MAKRQFGVSTRLHQTRRLGRDHLLEIAAHGFDAVELAARRTHIDYHNPAVVADLQQWLAEAALELTSIHVPMAEDAEQALFVARRIAVKTLVVETGTPREAARAIERLAALAAPLGVTIAVDSASWSPTGSLVHFVEDGPMETDVKVGICLDFGHAHREGDVAEIIETVSEHLVTTHVHDRRGRDEEHLVPFDGTIDWPGALTELLKIGYEGALVFDVGGRGAPKETLARAQKARERMESFLCMSI